MDPQSPDSPGVVALPPVIFLLALAAGGVLELFFPLNLLPAGVQYAVGGALILLSALPMPFVMRSFRRAGTPMDVRKAATRLVTGGPYRFSRNPAYLSMTLLYLGISVAADSLWMVLLALPLLVVMHYGVILREERYLEAEFGEAYRDYKRAVRRWF